MLASNYDFSSPFFRAAIIVNPGKGPLETRYELWFQDGTAPITAKVGQGVLVDGYTGGDESGKLSLSTLACVSDVSIDLGLGLIPQFTATLTPSFEDGRKILDSEIIEWSTSALEIQFGYSNNTLSPVYRGLIGQPDISYGTDITIGLKAQGVAGYFLDTTGLTGVLEKKTRLDHITALAKKLNVEVADVDVDDASFSLLNEEISLASGTKSYLSTIYQLARSSNCWLDLTENKLTLVSMTQVVGREPKAILRLFDFPNGKIGPGAGPGGKGVYPILSASSSTTGVYLSSYSKKAIMEALDRTTKKESQGTMDPKKVKVQQKGDVLPDNKSAETSTRMEQSPNQTDEGAGKVQEQANSAMQALSATDGAGIQLEIETLGFPDIIPAQNVQVFGLGTRIDGKYTVFKVTHKLSSSGYTSTLTLQQNSAMLTAALNGGLAAPAAGQQPSAGSMLDQLTNSGADGAQIPVNAQVQA